MEEESANTRSIIDEILPWDIEGDQMGGEMVLLEKSLNKFILRTSKAIKRKVKVGLLEVSLMNFILWISKEIK